MKEKTEERKNKIQEIRKMIINIFTFITDVLLAFVFFSVGKFIFCSKTIYKNLIYAITFVLAFLTLQVISNVVMNIPNSIQIFIGLVGAVFRADIHG